jgi:hypothetical protein
VNAIGTRPAPRKNEALVVSLDEEKAKRSEVGETPGNRWWACLDSNQEPNRYEREDIDRVR